MESLEGKVAVVTGGASGIGLGMATRFAKAGASVLLADIEGDALDAAAGDLERPGATVRTLVCDVSDEEAMDELAAKAFEWFDTVHVVCNNAGVGSGGLMSTLTTKDWQWCLGVNLWGVIHGIRVFLPRLLEQNEGHIVNTASVAGLFAAPFMGPYNASKFAVVAISETLLQELTLSASNVGVSVLCPAWVRTRIHEADRNRPDDLRNESVGEPNPQAAMMGELMRGVIESGMSPDAVAERVHRAIVEDEFYILTHPDSKAAVSGRMTAILEDGRPPFYMPQ